MRKIIYIFDEDDRYGGPKTGMEMILRLKNKGITPIVLTSKKNKVNEFCDKNNIENYVTHHHKYTYVQTNSKLKDCIKYIPRYIRYKIGNYIALNIIKRKIDMSQIDLIHANISAIDLGIKLSKKYNVKNCMHIREFGELDFNMHSYLKNYINYLDKNVDAFIAISNAIRSYWIKKGINSNKIYTVYNGVNSDDIQVKEKYNYDSKIKILMLGSIGEGKGQVELVQGISVLEENVKNNIEVDIIGTGYDFAEKRLQDEINKSNLNDIVNFKKYDSNIRSKIKDYDLGIICSKSEGFGRVTIEYMYAGLSVIASNTGANVELITNNENGLLYQKGDIKDLANKITHLYENRKEIERIGKNSINIAREKFSTELFAENVKKFYTETFFKNK